MKLTAEIKDGKFIYSYRVGASSGESTRKLDADLLCSFTEILKYCSSQSSEDSKNFMDGLRAKVWIDKNRVEAEELLQKKKEVK